MADDNTKNTTTSTSNPPNSSNPQSQDQDILSTFRRLADEHISAALHSVFGIPSILQTPSSSNWIIEENDRNRFDNINRREGQDESGHNGNDDNNNNSESGSGGISSHGGDSGSSGESSSSSSSISRDRADEKDLKSMIWNPAVSQLLLSLGLHSTALLERNFGYFHKEFQRLLEQQEDENKNSDSQPDLSPASETIIIKGSQSNNDEPKFTATRYSGPPSSIWKELFGEDMYGSQRTHPLFTSLFDEFLPDAAFNKQPPARPIGGWRIHGDSMLPFPADPVEGLFRMMVGSTIRRLGDIEKREGIDEMTRETDRMFREILDGQQKGLTMKDGLEEQEDEWREKESEFIKRLQDRRRDLATLKSLRDGTRDGERKVVDMRLVPVDEPKEERDPETELDLHNYFAVESEKNEAKVLVSQSSSTTSTTDGNGVTRIKRIRERRYSDGSVQREEHDDEIGPQRQLLKSSGPEVMERRREYSNPKGIGSKKDEMREAFAEERNRSERGDVVSKISQTERAQQIEQKGGWGSWLWASGRN